MKFIKQNVNSMYERIGESLSSFRLSLKQARKFLKIVIHVSSTPLGRGRPSSSS